MKKMLGFTIVSFWVVFCFFSIVQANDLSTKSQEKEVYWGTLTHEGIAGICARAMGLPEDRVNIIADASKKPDLLDSGFLQKDLQSSHYYLLDEKGKYVGGTADISFHDNIDGGKKAYKGISAREYYEKGDINNGDWRLGYALHYLQDVCIVLHTTYPVIPNTKHVEFELWVEANLNGGHKFLDKIKNDRVVYAVKDLKSAIREAAKKSSYNSGGIGKRVWDLYVAENYPKGRGAGSPELVKATTEMLLNAARYTKGTIEYVLSKYKMAR